MKLSPFIKPPGLILLFCFIYGCSLGQASKLYINKLKQRKAFVDSLISSYYTNPATALSHSIAHYTCLDSGGGSAELYQDVRKKNILQLYYFFQCDTVNMERAYYFMDNRIVLASIYRYDKQNGRQEKYYRHNKLIFDSNISANVPVKKDKDLLDGYLILKDIKK